MFLSIIVPVYNGEKTLRRAIDSLLSQTFKDLEIIIVNDGSKDHSGEIAEEYAAQDNRIVVINKPVNQGLSAGRNTGMAAAHGDYITFLDCDDWVEADMYQVMFENGGFADVIVTGAYHDVMNPDGSVGVFTKDAVGRSCVVDVRKEIIRWATELDAKRLFAYTWNKLYKRSFIESQGALFRQQTLIEDYQFNCEIWRNISRLTLVDGCYYHYVKFSNEALTQRYLPNYFEIMDKRYVLMRSLLEENQQFTGESREIICNMHIKHIISGMAKNCSEKAAMPVKDQRKVIADVLKNPNCAEAASYAKGRRKQELACNMVFKTGNVTINHLFAQLLHFLQNSKGNFFDKLK